MSDILILKEMIQDKVQVAMDNAQKKVLLTETQENYYTVTINKMPDQDNVIIIKADAFTSQSTVFKGKNGECKRADFIIIAHTSKKKVIICIELKKRKGSQREIIQQLRGSYCFAHYCQKIGQGFWEEKDFLRSYQYRFVSIDQINIPKRETQLKLQKDKHDTPEKMLKISSPKYLLFDQLAGKP